MTAVFTLPPPVYTDPVELGPRTPFADKIHREKYRSAGETFREAMTRIAHRLSDDDAHFRGFRDCLLHQRFMPGGRIQSAIGSTRGLTPYNCFVSGEIADSYVDGQGSIMERAKQAALTMRLGGGIGYDFSSLRPRGELIRKLDSKSSGPISFMEIFDAVCRTTSSSGHRRGAQMGVLRIDHPDIEEFIRAKQNADKLTGFNISVAVTDEFMERVEDDDSFDLRWDNKLYRTVRARDLWEALMRATYDWAEPGVLFIDRINKYNNLGYCERIAATNPCGEQPLPPFGACLLGSFNLTKYIERNSQIGKFEFRLERFLTDVSLVVRAMDNVVDVAIYPMFEQEQEAKNKRRMGLGITGAANAIEALGHPYGSYGFCMELSRILAQLRNAAYRASTQLAAEKGHFPAFRRDEYLKSPFVRDLPADVIDSIYEHGLRNSHLTSIAPTGTISLTADNVSSGIEPVFATSIQRTLVEFDGLKTYTITDYGLQNFGVVPKTSEQCTVDDHLAVIGACVPYVDSAVSKTCNLPEHISWEDFKDVYFRAWKLGCKGITTYRTGCKRGAVLKKAAAAPAVESGDSCAFDPVTGRRSCE